MAPTKWGIASAGLISHDFTNAIFSLKDPEGHQVVAVSARGLQSAQEFAKKFDIPKAYEGYEALANDPDVEVVYVGAINPAHLQIVTLMLNHGKHVLCEKPLAMNVKETKQLLQLAKEKGVFFMEALWSRFQPAYKKLKEEIDNGSIGKVYNVIVDFGIQTAKETPEAHQNRTSKKELGGGAVIDTGVYCIQLAQYIFNGEMPFKILAGGFLNQDGVDESVSATLLYSGGRTASFQLSFKVSTNCEANVYGSEGKMALKYPFWCANEIQLKDGEVIKYPLPEGKVDFNFWNSAGLGYEAQHVRECILKGLKESPIASHDDTLKIAQIMEEVRKQIGVTYDQDL